jgi:signal transduction histidine kinase
MVEHLARDLGSLRHGDHLCLPYDDSDERNQVIVPFIGEGLARGERCVYVLEADQHPQLLSLLAQGGVNAGRAVARGALWLRTPAEMYFRTGKFDPDDTLALVDELIEGALADGFSGVRGSGEICAPDRTGVPWPTMLSYEARFNERFAKRPFIALCRYHRADSPPAMIADALRTHPTVIAGARVCRNPYYEKPDIALGADRDAERVEWMLHQLRRSSFNDRRAQEITRSLAGETSRLAAENQSRAHVEADLERAVRMRDRFLDELTKELAGPVAGLAVELQALAHGSAGGERRGREDRGVPAARVAALGDHVKRLGAVMEELSEVSRLTSRHAVPPAEELDLADVVRRITLRNRERLAAAGSSVSLRTEARIQGRWDCRRVEQLVTNLLLSAAKFGAGQAIDVDLTTDGGTAIMTVRFRGAPRLADEEEGAWGHALRQRASDPRGRDAGAGLWVAREIAGALGGTVQISPCADTGPGVTVVSVELPRSGSRAKGPTVPAVGGDKISPPS